MLYTGNLAKYVLRKIAPVFCEVKVSMAHQHYRTKGIVLAKEDSGEADQIFTLYTKDFGKLEVIGKAIRKITSKLKSGIDVFYFAEIEFIQGKKQKTLTDAILLDKFPGIRQDLKKLSFIAQICQAVDYLANKEEKDEKIWDLLLIVFQKFNLLTTNGSSEIIFHYFLWNFFSLLGYSPELYNCCLCEKKLLPETFFFSPSNGGVLCWRCFARLKKEKEMEFKEKGQDIKQFKEAFSKQTNEIAVDTVKLIRFFLKEPLEKAERLAIWEGELKCLNKAFEIYFGFLSEHYGY